MPPSLAPLKIIMSVFSRHWNNVERSSKVSSLDFCTYSTWFNLTEMFYMVGLIRPPKNHRSWIPSCGSSVRHIWKAWSRFFGFRAKKRAETAKTADFGLKSSFLAQKWLDVLNPFWSSEMHQIWSICMILPKKLVYEAKLDIFGLFIY